MVYLDDIILISNTSQGHLGLLPAVLDRLMADGLMVSREKVHFCKPQLRYLGNFDDSQGLRPDGEEVQSISTAFIGTASWYHRFIPKLSPN